MLVKTGLPTSNPNSPIHQLHQKKHIIPFGRSMLEESVRISESDEFVFVKVISRSSHKLDKVVMGRSSWHRRRIREKCVL